MPNAFVGIFPGAKAVKSSETWRLGVIVSTNPLKVLLDTESEPLAATPDTVVGNLQIGDQVRLHRYGSTMTIMGVIGGQTGGGGSTPTGVTLKFGQWNLRYAGATDENWTSSDISTTPGKPDGGNRRWSVRKLLMAHTVIASGVSILTVQEADFPGTLNYQASDLTSAIQAVAPAGSSWRTLAFGQSRNAIIYNATVWEWDGVGQLEPSVWSERNLVWGVFRNVLTSKECIVGADHWHPDNATTRKTQATATHNVLETLKSRLNLPCILGVDTNDYGPTEGQAINAMKGSSFSDLREAFPDARRKEWATWHDWHPMMDGTALGQANNEWLDEIFTSHPTKVIAGGIWDTQLPLTSALASDHHLLTASIVITNVEVPLPVNDTGWRAHRGTFGSGWRQNATSKLQWRIRDGIVYWRGTIERTTGNVTTGYVVTSLPAEVRPAGGGYALSAVYSPNAGHVSIGAYPDQSGSLYVFASGALSSFRIGGCYPTT